MAAGRNQSRGAIMLYRNGWQRNASGVFAKSTATRLASLILTIRWPWAWPVHFDIEVLEIDPALEGINMQILLANPRGFCAG